MSVLEYRYKDGEGDEEWESLISSQYIKILPIDFNVFELKINGVVYTEWSEDVINEYEKVFAWERLSHDS